MMKYLSQRTKLSSLLPGLFVIPVAVLASMALVTWGILADSMVLAVQLVAGLCGGIVLWRWMLGAAWRPASILLVQVPFQGILGMYLGVVANFVTWLPIAAFLVQIPRGGHVRSLFGSRTQNLLGLLVFALSFSVIIAIPQADLPGLLKDFGQKVTLIFIVAALARGFLEPEFDKKAVLTISVSMAILVSVALVEQYLGVSLIGSAPKDFGHVGDYRLSGPGGSLPTNRMAFYHILPITLLVSALLTRHVRRRFLTILALLVLSVGLVSTGSRGGTMGTLFALGLIWLLGRRKITSGFLIGFLILGGAVVVSTLVPEETFTRSEGIGLLANLSDRIHVWESSFEAFMRNPFLGVGWGQLESTVLRDTIYSVGEVAASAHNSLLEMLSEAGLLGTIPFVALCWHVLRVLWRGTYLEEDGRGTLNVGVFAAFSGMLLATMTSVYQFERYFWVPVAFAASLELRGAFQADQGAQGDQSLTKQHGSTPRQGAFQTGK